MPDKKTWLSPSGVNGMDYCPRCFWIKYKKKIYQPEGIVSRLASRFDVVIKAYFDKYRPLGILPPLVEGKLEGKLQNPFTETYFCHYNDKYGYYGKLDECLITKDGLHSPVDHKTASSDPRQRDTLPAYQHQLDSYAWLLEANRKKTSGVGYLLYFYPDLGDKLHEGFPMINCVKTLNTDPKRAEEKFLRAVKILEGEIPEPSSSCPFCNWHEMMKIELGEINFSNQNATIPKNAKEKEEEKEEDIKKAWTKGRLF